MGILKGEIKMIIGKSKIEFGSGDICILSDLVNGIGVLSLANAYPHIIGERTERTINKDDCEVNIRFTKVESLDVVIEELTCVKSMMTGKCYFVNDRRKLK